MVEECQQVFGVQPEFFENLIHPRDACDGVVTLRGPVRSAQEKDSIARKAEQAAGPGKVVNELEVAG